MATFTITTSADNQARAIAAFTDRFKPVDGNGDPRDATGADIKAHLIAELVNTVHSYETRLVNEAASAGVTPIDPT
jgi:hypothetical protein